MRTGIVGLGLIGASLGGALSRAGFDVVGFDQDPSNARVALERGLVSKSAASLEDAVRDADLVVLATPLCATVSLVRAVPAMMRPGAVITDVASVKSPVIDAMDTVARVRAVGGHPIAGRESSGAHNADPNMFRGAAFAVVPTAHSDSAAIVLVEDLARAIGAIPVRVSASEHDAILARTSHLPQLVSTALAATLDGDCSSDLAGQGLRDMTRLAGSSKELWTEIFQANAANVLDALRELTATLERWETLLGAPDGPGMDEALQAGRSAVSKSANRNSEPVR